MEQEPLLDHQPLRAIRFRAFGLHPTVAIDPAYKDANAKLARYPKQYPNVTNLNFESTGLFVHAPFDGNELLYFDEHHLNEVGAKRYSAAARSVFSKIMD